MTIDKSLKVKKGLSGTRSVLTRAERLLKLKEAERWKEGASSILGMPKVRVMKLALKKKKKEKKEEEGADAKGGKAGAKPAAAAKPAAGAKPAAAAKPAAKK